MDTIRASQSIYAPTTTVGRDTRNTYGNIHLADSTVSGVGMIKQPPAVLHGKKKREVIGHPIPDPNGRRKISRRLRSWPERSSARSA